MALATSTGISATSSSTTTAASASVNLEDLEKDDFLQQIQSPSFSIQNYVTSLLTSTTVNLSAQISSLTQSLSKIDQAIHVQVTTNHGDLLAQTSNVEVMDGVVLSCQGRAKQCLETAERLRQQMDNYEEELVKEVTSLERLLALKALVRRTQRIVKLENLQNLSAAKQAQVVTEIEYLCTGSTEPFLKNHLEAANSLRRNIKKQTENMLSHGLGANSSNQISSSLQIFINLNSLDGIVGKLFADIEKTILKDLSTALNFKIQSATATRGPPGRAASLSTSVTNQSNQIWSNLTSLSNKIVASCAKIKLLWLVLETHRDSDSNILYSKFLNEENNYWNQFWLNFISNFEKEFNSSSEIIKGTFEADYPKLLNFVTSLSEAIEEKDQQSEIAPALLQLGLGQSLRSSIASFEKAYLSKSLSKLFDHINHIFVSGFPSEPNVDDSVALLKNNLSVTTDEQLKKLLWRNVSKTIQLFCVRCEGLTIVDGGATQVIGPPTPSQQTNAKIINLLDYFKLKLRGLASSAPASSVVPVEDLESISVLQRNIVWNLVNGIADAIEAIVLTIHQEQWGRTNRTTEYSLYMGELQAFIARAAKDYFCNIQSSELLHTCTAHLSSRTIDLLTRHVSILPSLNKIKGQITTDLTQLEIALTPFTPVLSELGKPYKLLKGFKTLVNIDPKEIEESNLIPTVVPPSLALNFLFTISDDELMLTPQAVRGWSTVRYSRWLDDKSETERIQCIKSALNDYVKNVSSKERQEFHWVYPIMLGIIKRVT